MNWDTVKGDWQQFSGKVKEQWGKLTDDELTQINGNGNNLRASFKRNTVMRRTRPRRKSTPGATARSRNSLDYRKRACAADRFRRH
jgi:uncharacterized protein YjbJ (UPF0337 family)